MALEHGDKAFSPPEQEQILALAARLQAQHAENVGPEDLVRVAEEVGIEERFVVEAAQAIRLGITSVAVSDRNRMEDAARALAPLLLLHLALIPRDIGTAVLSTPLYGVFLLATGMLAFRAVRRGAAPWAVPFVQVAAWMLSYALTAIQRFSPVAFFDMRFLQNKELPMIFAVAIGAALLGYVVEKMEIRPRAAKVGS